MRASVSVLTRPSLRVLGLLGSLAATALAGTRSPDEAAIRAAREASNRAIAVHDLAGVTRFWLPDVHIVTSTSAQASGIEANRERMARQFAAHPEIIYVRRPAAIEVFESWTVASETGTWTGRWTDPDGAVEIAGRYQAQWRKLDGEWRIQAELFVPTRCRGGRYCAERP